MSLPQPVPRVVAAVAAALEPRLRAILPGCALCLVRSGSELVRALDEAPCAMLIVEVHYDHAGAAAALRCVLARNEGFPVVCVRGVACAEPGFAVLNALRLALGRAAASGFVDLSAQPDDESGNARLATMMHGLMSRPAA